MINYKFSEETMDLKNIRWNKNKYRDFIAYLFEFSDEKYAEFARKLNPNSENILGIRLPQLKKFAKEISKGDWQCYLKYAGDKYFEEIMINGFVIAFIKTDIEQVIELLKGFVPKIESWSICDSVCAALHCVKKNKKEMLNFINLLLNSEKEFELRFAVVLLLDYYIDEEHIESVLKRYDSIKHDGYYVKMAVSWGVSVCFVKFPEITLDYLNNNTLDTFTYKKTLQKILESQRVDSDNKKIIKQLRNNK